MLTIVRLAPNQRALVLRNGQPDAFLSSGRHFVWGFARSIEVRLFDVDQGYTPATPELLARLPSQEGIEHRVGATELGFLSVDGIPRAVLLPGRYVLWQARALVECNNVSTTPLFSEKIGAFRALLPSTHVQTYVVSPFERTLLYVDGKLEATLQEGMYDVFVKDRKVTAKSIDTREQEQQIVGQEVMTADKVTLRINIIVKFRITDAVKAAHNVTDLANGIYSEAQLAARKYLGGLTIDQLLEKRAEAAEYMRSEVSSRLDSWGLEVLRIDLKDVVLPGEMKTLLNQVIEAEKRAAANVILRREETAATRSLANTAKLLESNPTLLRLKELEAWKEIAQSVGQITVVASPQNLMNALSLNALPPGESKKEA